MKMDSLTRIVIASTLALGISGCYAGKFEHLNPYRNRLKKGVFEIRDIFDDIRPIKDRLGNENVYYITELNKKIQQSYMQV